MRNNAIDVLSNILKNKVFFAKTDDGFVNMLVLTALRNLLYIEKTIKQFSKKRSDAHYVLVCAVAEILYLKTPDYAVINSYVDIAKKEYGKFVANFLNAVLRKVCANKEDIISSDDNRFFPDSFLNILRADYDNKTIKQMAQDCKIEPKTNIVYKDGRQEFIDTSVVEVEGFNEGEFWVQDKSSATAVEMLGKIEGLRVLDLCSAPGGKTAQLISKGAKVTCVDISQDRLNILQSNMQRLHYTPEAIVCQDAVEYLKNFTGDLFDIILLDAPCSATGTLRRHPEVVYIKDIKDVRNMKEIQQYLLSVCSLALKKGGVLMYCTCSVSKIEGEMQITKILSTKQYKELQQQRIIPNINQDGFFISKLERL